ncbi:hypothetical protein EEL31_16220 [Brevibacillus laterosporus]|uniref:Uncharacterized protein n=1 Tax=Brevibacillus laterosporus TaxID=1465 RepID=A0A518V3D2_BRELA|nr:hypothetical protein [Brevibacillus laterosporus]QDX91506.1 hypothetical protein EEL30_03430 [Brevibacillus laterosporus]RAP28446.1 hypothetical protein C2W64_04880 [Brevibacillus laterosporus]TPG69876.1 hypothetical protein EEL31_16220 [Brevibacillus laterosporus]
MKNLEREIWINVEQSENKNYNIYDNNVDVMVTLSDRSKWVATFFTYENITTLQQKNEKTGENMKGAYLWASDMVLVDNVSRKRIEEIVDHLLKEDEFKYIFVHCEDDQ